MIYECKGIVCGNKWSPGKEIKCSNQQQSIPFTSNINLCWQCQKKQQQKKTKQMWYIDVIVVFDFELSHTLTL